MACGCSGTPTVSSMTVEQLQAEQDRRREAQRQAQEQYAASMQRAMVNAGSTPSQ